MLISYSSGWKYVLTLTAVLNMDVCEHAPKNTSELQL